MGNVCLAKLTSPQVVKCYQDTFSAFIDYTLIPEDAHISNLIHVPKKIQSLHLSTYLMQCLRYELAIKDCFYYQNDLTITFRGGDEQITFVIMPLNFLSSL